MKLNSIEEIIEDIHQGKMVILMDDEDRENEGDLIVAAEKITTEQVNFMAAKARGLICLTLTGERCDFLGLPSMVQSENGSQYGTPFTVSIEAAEGVTTGISAADRALTIQRAVDPESTPQDIVQPGHIFPLRAQPGGVLSRAGHTEAGCDLARIAGLIPAAAIVEVMNEDGTMARRPDLEKFAELHDLKIGTIADLIHYRILHDKTVDRIDEKTLSTEFGEFTLTRFKDRIHDQSHIALSMGQWSADQPTLVRVHVADTLRDLLGNHQPGSGSWSLRNAMQRIAEEGNGVAVLLNSDDSLSMDQCLDAYFNPQQPRTPGRDGVGAYHTIGTGSQILREMGIGKMRLLSSPIRFSAISGFDLEITEYISCEEQ
ncbi:3,4-dihydroxy-2-butanone-4-phosphate synthase [Aestuariirhabdus sp. Z084]|uniref:bifunctional 3,4-dihydroxy-2-butanone-4-phosphate synthase/GTP cyclohydrolase II n=1 Tax=Aestuariirhabdus haliotis TaxID=2918751 RepID=UPI00201B3D6D|nr:bifunctional 3,4-dihydroxy-2-butanone-4-phosphate synthase/GTP cyclohydrolase II [Aestuariirhabdus haliotis]MCL6415062.1 3,4-dihydroxy-2-butanone-4-phosphate synthase [Aestuariirhabdus haliotis]MCL6418994.1 3,4-dihydroxy-2-butanone-4-phosphate synthase [Aestuariirhabdus haliotis]